MQRAKNILAPARLAQTVGIALSLLMVGLFWTGTALLDQLEFKTYDMRLRALQSVRPQQVTIAAIDEQSLAALGRWPWSRMTMAKLTDRLAEAGARVVAYDVFFPEHESAQADAALGRAVGSGRNVVLGTVFLFSAEETRYLAPGRAEEAKRSVAAHAIADLRQPTDARFAMASPRGVLVNIPQLEKSAIYTGHVNVMPEADGVVRRAPLIFRYGDSYFPSFDVQAARAFLGSKPLVLHAAEYGLTALEIDGRRVPIDEEGRILVRYRGGEGTYDRVSIADILDGRADPALIKDRVVVVGSTAKGIADFRSTPVGGTFPGVEIRANIIQNLLAGDVLQRPEWMFVVDAVILVVLGLALSFLLPRLGVFPGGMTALALLAAYLFFANNLFRSEGLWINVVYPSLLIILLFVSTTLVHYFSSQSQQRFLKNAFAYYVPPEVVDELAADADKLCLGGEKRELTVLFSDIRGFTGMSETLAPEDLVKLLNVYFTAMTSQVFAHRGSLDKYIGDAIMAMFGAPVAHPEHARAACRSALDMMKTLAVLQAEWKAKGLPEINIGIGINTGPVIVGNMGSQSRFNYTVVGDAVNVASRIESINKKYGSNILISEFTWAQTGGEFAAIGREIDRVQVRGRAQPIGLFELIPEHRYASLDWLGEFARAYQQMRAGDVRAAEAGFEALVTRLGDPVSAYHLQTLRQPRRRAEDDAG